VANSLLAWLADRNLFVRTARDQLHQQPVQPVHRGGAHRAELVAAVHQQPQRDRQLIDLHRPQTRGAQRDHSDRVRVGGISLAALPGGEHPDPRRQLRRHVHHRLPVRDQTLRQVPADALATLHRPDPIRPPPPRIEQLLVAGAIGLEPTRHQHRLPLVEDLDRRRPLCGSIPITTCGAPSRSGISRSLAVDGHAARSSIVAELW
jgi:hypothetical protein